jgi:hypothetical protein
MSLSLADLARNPGRKATGDDGAVYVWDDGDLWRLHPGPFNDGESVMFDDDVKYFYEPVQQGPALFTAWRNE